MKKQKNSKKMEQNSQKSTPKIILDFDKNIVLVGNPNTGKTTFFNAITASNEHIGNWHGVTVDFKEKVINHNGERVKVTDLPGIYSLCSYSFEEQVARDYIYSSHAQVIDVCDANNLARNLYLTLQLKELGLSPIVCINMANELKKQGKQIDEKKLAKMLGLDVFLINAQSKKQSKQLLDFALKKSPLTNVSMQNNIVSSCNINEYFSKKSRSSENRDKTTTTENISNQILIQNLQSPPNDLTSKSKSEYAKKHKNIFSKIFSKNKQKKQNIKVDCCGENTLASTDIYAECFSQIDFEKISNILGDNLTKINLPKGFVILKLLEKDEFIEQQLSLSNEQKNLLKPYLERFDESYIASKRYNFIDKIISTCQTENKKNVYGFSKLDKIVLNKYLALPIFLGIVALIFFLTFSSVGKFLTDKLNYFVERFLAQPCIEFVTSHTTNQFLISFVKDAIFGGVCSLLSFLPQIALLFLLLSILEDSGYLSRLAFTLEDYFSLIGLSGKSVFTLLMGFGCSTTSTMTARTLEDKNSKIKTAMLSPYLSCSAKIPLYTVICTAFFVKQKFLIIFSLYLLSVLVAILVSFILQKTILKSGETSFIMELPPYRFPKINRISNVLWSNIKSFVLRVGSLIVSFSIIIWILESCDFSFRLNPENSILRQIGLFLAPIFSPLGFGSWGAIACLICGIVAKEIIVGTMGIINNVGADSSSNAISQSLLLSTSSLALNPCSALSFLVFSLLYMPCISTIGVMKKEIGSKWTLIAIIIQLSIAYILSFAVYRISLCFTINGFVSGLISLATFVLIVVALIVLLKFIKSKNKCKFCPNKTRCGDCKNKI